MAKKDSIFSNVDLSKFGNLEDVLNKTKDVAEEVGKRSSERIELSRKKIELLDAKTKLAKLYEKFGKFIYENLNEDEIDEEERADLISKITQLRETSENLKEEIDEAKESINDAVSNASKRAKEIFNQDKSVTQGNTVESDAQITDLQENDE